MSALRNARVTIAGALSTRDAKGESVVARKLTRHQLIPFFAELPPCVVAMEACSSAHHWGQALIELGHEVRLLPPAHVKPYLRRNKSDQVDAAAIYEAMSRPGQRFVPVRSIENQAALMRHRARELLPASARRRSIALRAIWPRSASSRRRARSMPMA
jgi:transposase